MERQALVLHIEKLHVEVAKAREELECAEPELYEPRIRELEGELADMRRWIVDVRKSIASNGRPRWQRWPAGTIVIVILFVVAVVECR